MKQEMMGWQRHQLDHMQIINTSFHTDNHASNKEINSLGLGLVSGSGLAVDIC